MFCHAAVIYGALLSLRAVEHFSLDRMAARTEFQFKAVADRAVQTAYTHIIHIRLPRLDRADDVADGSNALAVEEFVHFLNYTYRSVRISEDSGSHLNGAGTCHH